MLFLIAKRNPSLILPFFNAHQTLNPIPRCFYSALATQTPSIDPKPLNFLADHLITSWDFSPNKAAIISKRLPNLKNPENADAVIRFLTRQGFAKADIHTLTTWQPTLLLANPDRTLTPNLRTLHGIGLSVPALTQILVSGPAALLLLSAVPRITFWRDFFRGDEAALVKAFKLNIGLVGYDIARSIAPKLSLLETHGLSAHHIRNILLRVPWFITTRVAVMEEVLKRTKEFGFQPGTGMFISGLHAMSRVTSELVQKKMELLMSFGWSEDEFRSALRKAPGIVSLSEENLRATMDFLLGETRCDPSYVASHPLLLQYSLEKRLRPRQCVLHLLESKGLCGRKQGFFSGINMSDRKFVERYILPHNKENSGLHEVYIAACASGSGSPL